MGSLDGPTVAPANGTDNRTINQVVGNRSDGHNTTTLSGRLHQVTEHIHSVQRVYPNLGTGITVTGHANAWTLGDAATVVAGGVIALDFDIHHISINTISANDTYQLNLYDDGSLICEVAFTKSPTTDPVRAFPVVTPLISANSVITAKLASAGGGGDTLVMKIWYHTY